MKLDKFRKTLLMKRCLFAYIVVAISMAGTFGYTHAYFNDSELSTDNQLSVISNWSDFTWQYRKEITIYNGTGSTLTNFQIRIAVNTYELITTLGHMQTNGQDIRFYDYTGVTEYPYWIDLGIDTIRTFIWVKIAALPAGYSSYYMYYGNPAALAASNGYNTFIFFDDFEDGLSQWTAVNPTRGTLSQVSSPVQHGSYAMLMDDTSTGGTFGAYATVSNQTICVIEYYARPVQTNDIWEMRIQQNTTIGPRMRFHDNVRIQYNDTAWRNFDPEQSYTANTWYEFKLDEVDSGTNPDTYDVYIGGIPKKDNTAYDNNVSYLNRIQFSTATNNEVPNMYVDLVKVRTYASPEPYVTGVGEEEQIIR